MIKIPRRRKTSLPMFVLAIVAYAFFLAVLFVIVQPGIESAFISVGIEAGSSEFVAYLLVSVVFMLLIAFLPSINPLNGRKKK